MWEYLLVLILSATPWIEILFVVPPAIAAGLHPVPVAFIALTGNFLPIIFIVYLYEKWNSWRASRRIDNTEVRHTESRRNKLGRKIWDKYGLPGLSLLAPIVTGVHLAAIIALLAKSPRSSILFWMFCSLVLWTIFLASATHYGLDFLGFTF